MGVNLTPWRAKAVEETRDAYALSFGDYLGQLLQFGYGGLTYTVPGNVQENPGGDFSGLVRYAYKSNGVVFACMLVRMLLFSEARLQFRQRTRGRPGPLFGTAELAGLEAPWPGGTTGDLLSKMIQYADIAGNAFVAKARSRAGVTVLRPDWTSILLGSYGGDGAVAWDIDAEVVGYVYQPGGPAGGRGEVLYGADEVAHFAPIPDPEAQFRGMSWLTPIVREIMADKAATAHKLSFFEKGATPNMVVKLDVTDLEKMKGWIESFKEQHEGSVNAYKTLFLGAGADATVVGANMREVEFKQTIGSGETRIAAAAGVPPVIVGLSEGLQAATYSNYGQARRRFADGTMRPLWRNACGSLARIVAVPPGAELWYDDRDISFLQEDLKDAAEIMQVRATATKTFVDAGYSPDSSVAAVNADDLGLLVHTGLVSVQLQPPGADPPEPPAPARTNGNGHDDDGIALLRAELERRELERRELERERRLAAVEAREPMHVTVAPPTVEIAEGAIRSDVRVEAAEPAQMAIHEGAVQVTVEPARTEIQEGAVQVTVETPTVEIAEGAIVSNVTVEPARVDVDFAEGAIRSDVTVEPTQVDVHLPPAEKARRATAKRGAGGELEVTYHDEEKEAE